MFTYIKNKVKDTIQVHTYYYEIQIEIYKRDGKCIERDIYKEEYMEHLKCRV
jgi:hypothetical protein